MLILPVWLLVESKLVGDNLLELKEGHIAVDPDLDSLAVLLASLELVNDCQNEFFGWLQTRMRSNTTQTVLLRVMNEHLHVLQASLDALLLNRQDLLKTKSTDFLIARHERGFFVWIPVLNRLQVALDQRNAALREMALKL